MGREAERERIGGAHPLTGQRKIEAGLARQARQRPGRAHVREEADPDLRHGEGIAVARHAVAAVQRHPDPAAHDESVDERHIRLRIALDADVERVFLAPEPKRLVPPPGLSEFVEMANVAAGAERPLARARHHHARHVRVVRPGIERAAHGAHHVERQRVQGLGPVQRDQARRAVLFADDLRRLGHHVLPSAAA